MHLHVHSTYSILDGLCSIEGIVEKCMADGQEAVALTDHGSMMGIKALWNEVKKQRSKGKKAPKPILGCEMYVAREGKEQKRGRRDAGGWHLIVLAKNEVGYHNLLRLVSESWVEGFYFKPRTDKASLEKWSEGLVVCSACLAGEVPQKILSGDLEGAREAVRWAKGVWGEDYYLEVQRHEVKDASIRADREVWEKEKVVEQAVRRLAKEEGVKMVATNDCHFLNKEDAEAHDLLVCISTGKQRDDEARLLYTKQEWLKTREEMWAMMGDLPEALEGTVEVARKIEEYDIDSKPIMPQFPIPKSFMKQGEERTKSEGRYLAHLTRQGAVERYGKELSAEVEERMAYELGVIESMGFPGYFLIVADYIRAAREELGVIVGPGRGSAAGSIVAYCLGITQIDPLRYDLLFERFLNPDRISLPDVDVDFDDEGRGRVLDWVTRKYGAERVAHIITYGTLGVKSAIRDCCRALGIPLSESLRLQKAVPLMRLKDEKGQDVKVTMKNARRLVGELRAIDEGKDRRLKEMLDIAERLEGTVRSTGVHACGIIICRDPIEEHVPVSTADDKETGERLRCTQYEGSVIEETGLIKMDFLGLTNLTIIKESLENIKERTGREIDIDRIGLDDEKTYRLFQEGRTVGIFQFESGGMQKYLRELKPSRLEDLIAMNALYRPGPMAYIPQFIKRKHGLEPISYDLPCMERYLRETYGITVYQEQVMLLSREIAGFSRGESDTLRKAMGKKQKDKLDHLYPKFIEGGVKRGHPKATLEKIWKDWEAFASYAFNKSHATCYAWIAYQTAWLKANYGPEYMAACISQSFGDIGEIEKLMGETRSMGIETLGPDVNESRVKFASVGRGKLRFGLAGIKGIGTGVAAKIVEEREQGGRYKDIYDFVSRLSATSCNKTVIENLAGAGALDSLGLERAAYFAPIREGSDETFAQELMKYAGRVWNEKGSGAISLFGDMEGFEITKPEPPRVAKEWTAMEKLGREKELVGMYLSSHPLRDYKAVLEGVCNTAAGDLERLKTKENVGRHVAMGVLVSEAEERMGKRGAAYGIVRMEDFKSKGELMLFGGAWATWRGFFAPGNALLIEGEIAAGDHWHADRIDFVISGIEFLEEAQKKRIERLTLRVGLDDVGSEAFGGLIGYMKKHKGRTALRIEVEDGARRLRTTLKSALGVKVNTEMIEHLEQQTAAEWQIN